MSNEATPSYMSYLDRRVYRLFLLGFISGLPWVLIGSALSLWLKEVGLSRTGIGYAGAIFAVYSINFMWAPLLDRFAPPLLGKLGHRKSWIVLCLWVMAAAALLAASSDPAANARFTVLCCLLIAAASATQDIAIDAYRIDSIPEQQPELIAPAAAMATAGWWTGFSGIGALALWLSDQPGIGWDSVFMGSAILLVALSLIIGFYRELHGAERHDFRQSQLEQLLQLTQRAKPAFKLLALALLAIPFIEIVWLIGGAPGLANSLINSIYLVPLLFVVAVTALTAAMLLIASIQARQDLHPASASLQRPSALDYSCAYILDVFVQPFASFIRNNGLRLALAILGFIFLFKIGEAFLGRMSIIFYSELGFSNSEIGQYSKLVNWLVTIVVSLAGGLLSMRFGMIRGLMLAGLAMATSNLLFSAMALYGPAHWLFATTVVIDGITSAWSNVAFVGFLSFLCDKNFSASQYALFASIGTLGRTLLSSGSGSIIDHLDGNWALFFLLTALAVIPALLLLATLGNKLTRVTANAAAADEAPPSD